MNAARILIVEDELVLAEDIARLLKESGHEIIGLASSGEDAIRVALETKPDLLLMDIRLKTEMDGVQAAGFIRSVFDVPIIFLTAFSDQELFERAKATGPAVYLSKPVLPIELTRNVEMVLLRHQLTKKVRESEERLRSILSSMDDCVLVLDKSGLLVEFHEGGSGCGMLPAPEEMLLGQHFSEVAPPNLAKLLEDAFKAIAAEGQVQAFDYCVERDGRELWFSAKVSMVRGDNGDSAGAAMVARDITERKRAEEALKSSEERYRNVVEMLNEGLVIVDETTCFTYVNPKFASMLECSADELIGRAVCEVLASDQREASALEAAKRRQGISSSYESVLVAKQGKEIPVIVSARPLRDEAGQIQGGIAVVTDISERKRFEDSLKQARDDLELRVKKRTADLLRANEQLREEMDARIKAEQASHETEGRLRAIVETATDSIFIKDQTLKYVFVNPAFRNLVGLPFRSILAKSDGDLFGPDAEVHAKEVEQRVLAGEIVEEEYTRLVQGAPVTFLDIRAPMRDELGNVVGVCGISRNITERIRTLSSSAPVPTEFASLAMRSTMTAAHLAAQTDSICLITGESGSGKDRLARHIHDKSKRSGGPFYSINCAAIPRELAESELFGYEAGAFTGANRRKRGLIELAEGGTLLLNEISELPLELQSKMLSFLDTMSITRVGGQKTFSVNVRLIAATNLDLQKEMAEGRFRTDLFYRLNVFTIMVPPLRDRPEDIAILLNAILSELVPQMGLSEMPRLDGQIFERLQRYAWPGNVRELRNVLERALILSQGRSLLVQDIVLEPGQSYQEVGTPVLRPEKPLNQILGSLQSSLIEEALDRCGGNKKKTAEVLGISRYALARYMRKLGLSER
jgi:sigma-54 dependent transcriptional regulator, acetoin dehydrogenase operon transcriptional activator AcoR